MYTTLLNMELHVMNDEKFVYKVVGYQDSSSKNEHVLYYFLELVAGWDYVNPDFSDKQGFVTANKFTERIQNDFFSVFPLYESLKERFEEEGYKIIRIEDITIHG